MAMDRGKVKTYRNATVQKHHEAETTANAETEDSPPQLWALLIQCSGCQ